MFRILIADDEPIILSGIRHLIDWGAEDAVIVGSARNGAEAFAMIESEHPDIVITDIRMPVLDGLSLAEKCREPYPSIVFIILTSLAEFSLAREAIGYGVSDYLLKTELSEEMLRSALDKAKAESIRRRGLSEAYEDTESGSLTPMISGLFLFRDISARTRNALFRAGLLSSFAFISVVFSFPSESLEKHWTGDDYRKLRDWEKDVVEKVLPSVPGSFHPVSPASGKQSTLIYLVSGVDAGTWQAVASRLSDRISKASGMVTGLSAELLTTSVFSGRDELKEAREALELSLTAHYLEKDESTISVRPLEVDSSFPKLELSIRAKDSVGCRAVFMRMRELVKSVDHTLSQLEFSVSALRSAVSSGLSSLGLGENTAVDDIFENADFLSRRSEVILFLSDVENALVGVLESTGGAGGSVADRAREYVLSHITERISLSDVADYTCVSPGYMSKSFKRIMGMSLVDYINQQKVIKAKEMMGSGETRIADIALSLGFTNIYYFSKVFRKVEGIPPTEYLRRSSREL